MKEPKTPELDKLLKVHDQSQHIGEFLEWLFNTKGLTPGRWPRPNECTGCGCDRKVHNQTHVEVSEAYESLIRGLDLSPEVKDVIRKRLLERGTADAISAWVGAGCNVCGTSRCNQYQHDEEHLIPEPQRIETFLAEYFSIDEKKAEAERRALLDDVRSQNKEK